MKYLLATTLFFVGCGSSRIPSISIPSFSSTMVNEQFYNWANLASYAGGLLVFCGVIAFVWARDKSIGVRCIANGFLFVLVAKLMEFVSCHLGWFLLLSFVTFIIFNLERVEKILMKFGLRIDLNRDGKYGSELIPNDFCDDDTVKIIKD